MSRSFRLRHVYLDFDGELTNYRNADLDFTVDDVHIEHSNLSGYLGFRRSFFIKKQVQTMLFYLYDLKKGNQSCIIKHRRNRIRRFLSDISRQTVCN